MSAPAPPPKKSRSVLKISPIQVPAMVAAHCDYLRSTAYHTYAAGYIKSRWEEDAKKATPDIGEQWCLAELNAMRHARLFHITEPMFSVARLMSEKLGSQLDNSEVWTLDSLPSPFGVLVFEKGIYVLDVWGAQTSYAMASWSRVSNRNKSGTLFNLYSDLADLGDYYNLIMAGDPATQLRGSCGRWLWDHSVFIADDESVVYVFTPGELEAETKKYRETHVNEYPAEGEIELSVRSDHPFTHANEVLKTLYCIFTLMGETRMVDLDDLHDKKLARRYQHKKNTPSPMVTVIQLRRPDHYGYYEKGTGTWLTYRSWTAAHRRRVHYGPKGESVKWIWVSSYLRGPDDAPIRKVDRVTTLSK